MSAGTPAASLVRLPDGRRLSYAEHGLPDGRPVLVFPGTPGSRLLRLPEEATRAAGVRTLVIERPGCGCSDFQPGRTLLDWPKDVTAFADALGIERFAVVGISGGGPYAAACAYALPSRVIHTAILGGVGPVTETNLQEMPRVRQVMAWFARHAPALVAPLLWLFGNPQRNPEGFYERMLSQNSAVDLEILRRPEMKAAMMASYRESTRNGIRGFAREGIIASNDWGFQPEQIASPVSIWHGEEDFNVPMSAVKALAERIPGCRAHFVPGEGHWLFLKYWEEILRELDG
jgi:pimeloyl-ACP methyl ester carboxylesterase